MKRGKSMSETVAPGRCKAFNRRGGPCSSPTVGRDGFCAAHSGKLDMKALGSKGGKDRTRAVLGIDDSKNRSRGSKRSLVAGLGDLSASGAFQPPLVRD